MKSLSSGQNEIPRERSRIQKNREEHRRKQDFNAHPKKEKAEYEIKKKHISTLTSIP